MIYPLIKRPLNRSGADNPMISPGQETVMSPWGSIEQNALLGAAEQTPLEPSLGFVEQVSEVTTPRDFREIDRFENLKILDFENQ